MKLSASRWTLNLLLLTVGILAVFGIGSFLRILPNPDRAMLYGFYGLAMLADAALLLFCAWQLSKGTKLGFYLSVAVLAVNIVLTLFDQVGWVDVLFMLLNLVALVFLLLARKEVLPA